MGLSARASRLSPRKAAGESSVRGAIARWLIRFVAALIVAIVAWVAGRASLSSSAVTAGEPSGTVVVSVVDSTVGRELSVSAAAVRTLTDLAPNALSGVLTRVAPSGLKNTGETAYRVSEVPVRIVQGDIPFYRDMFPGLEGADVDALRSALVDLKYLSGPATGPFTTSVASAVRAWQKDLSIPQTGTVPLGELVAVPALPAVVTVSPDATLGMQLAGGESILKIADPAPRFEMVLTSAQARQLLPDMKITVTYNESRWPATLGSESVNESGDTVLVLNGHGGGPVCQDECGVLPPEPRTLLAATVELVPETTGPAIPASALRVDSTGAAYVILEGGRRAPVTVLASDNGMVVIDGLSSGDRVLALEGGG